MDRFFYRIILSLASILLGLQVFGHHPEDRTNASDNHSKAHIFEENKGQLPEHILYRMQNVAATMYMEKNRMTWHLKEHSGDGQCGHPHHCDDPENALINNHVFHIEFSGTSGSDSVIYTGASFKYSNYIRGKDPKDWVSFVRDYKEALMIGIYPGIDMQMYGANEGLKYDWIVQPGADPENIKLNYSFTEGIRIVDGDLHIKTSVETVIEKAPYAYQIIKGKQVEVPCEFKLNGSSVTYELGEYVHSIPLIIDPILVFSTYTGARGDNWGMTATPGLNDEFFAGGVVFAEGYPEVSGGFQSRPGGVNLRDQTNPVNITDIAITKFTPDGSQIEYSTYLGGSGTEVPHSIIANSLNELVILGTTSSPNFPTTRNAFDRDFSGGRSFESNGIDYENGSDIAVAVLSADGSTLVGSTYIGGSENDGINNREFLAYNYGDPFRGEVVLDDNDNIFVASSTQSNNFPTRNAFSSRFSGDQDACFFSLDRRCSNLIFSSFLGGGEADSGYGIKVNSQGEIYITGGTRSNNFPVSNGFSPNYNGGDADGYIARFSRDGSTLLNSTFIGTNTYDQSYFIALDFEDQVYITGQSLGNMPVSNNTFNNPGGTQFIQKYNADLNALERSTVFGSGRNTIDISLTALMIDTCGRAFLSGWGGNNNSDNGALYVKAQNSSTDGMSVTSDAFRSTTNGTDFYFLVLERDFEDIIYGSFFGEIERDGQSGDHVDGGTSRFSSKGVIYQAVCSSCGGTNGFPTTTNAYSRVNGASRNSNEEFNGGQCNLAAVKFDFQLTELIAGADLELDTFGCAPYNAQFINQSFGANAYEWTFGDGGSSTLRNPTHEYQDTGTYQVQMIALTDNNCLDPDTLEFDIVIIEPPQPESDTILLCDAPSVVIESRRDNPFTSYQWNGGSTRRSIIAFSSGIYSVSATESNCLYIDTFDVTLINPEITLEDEIICGVEPYVIDIDERASNIRWSTGDTTNSITAEENGLYTVSYLIDICAYQDSTYLSFAQEPDIEIVGDSIICDGEPLKLMVVNNNPNATIDNYQWSNNENTEEIEITMPGSYEVVATTDSSCIDEAQVNIVLLPFIDVEEQQDTLICMASELIVDYSPYEEIAEISWSDGSTESIRRFDTEGKYSFRINNFCQDINGEISLAISPFEKTDRPIYVPNSFTPNGDGVNDIFKAEKAAEMEILDYLFIVYDRWGNKIFESRNIEDGWDGSFQGQEMDPAIFAYYLEAEYFICEAPEIITISGDVSLQK